MPGIDDLRLMSYQLTEEDLFNIVDSHEWIVDKNFFEDELPRPYAIVTADSTHRYIFLSDELDILETQTDLNYVETRNGFNIYKYQKSPEEQGRWIEGKEFYTSTAWDEDFEEGGFVYQRLKTPESFAVPNPNRLTDKDLIIPSILVTPVGIREIIGRYLPLLETRAYLIHELAHLEEMIVRDWPYYDIYGEFGAFPTKENFLGFIELISEYNNIPHEITEIHEIYSNQGVLPRALIGEFYAFIYDVWTHLKMLKEGLIENLEEWENELEREYEKCWEGKKKERYPYISPNKYGLILAYSILTNNDLTDDEIKEFLRQIRELMKS